MIAVDTNLLVYAHREDSTFHRVAKALVSGLRENSAQWAIPWPCVHEFIAIVTHPRIYAPPSPFGKALAAVESWQAGNNLQFLAESCGYLEKLKRIAVAAGVSGGRIHDARVAALCLHHGVNELWSADRDFSLFPELKVRSPLVQSP